MKFGVLKCIIAATIYLIPFNLIRAQVMIKGTVLDSFQKEIVLFEPIISGFYNDKIKDSSFIIQTTGLKINRPYTFERTVSIREPMMLCLAAGRVRCYFIAFPRDTIEIAINLDAVGVNFQKVFTFKGAGAAGNNVLNHQYLPFINPITDFKNGLIAAHFFGQRRHISLFDSVLKKQNGQFDQLLQKNKITKGFHSFATKMIFNTLITSFLRDVYKSQKYNVEEKIELVKTFNEFYNIEDSDPVLRNNLMSATISSSKYRWDQAIYDKIFRNSPHSPGKYITVKGAKYFVQGDFVPWLRAPQSLQEGLWAYELIIFKQIAAGQYSQKDAATYLACFPHSPFKKYFVPPYYGLPPWSKEDSASARFFVLNKNDNLDSIVAYYFKGKNVLIDLWATWCSPCKEQFLHNPDVERFCEENNIEKLYISVDKMDAVEDMKNDAYAYQLKGIHVMATYTLQQDLVKRIYNNGKEELTIPRYAFIDSTGSLKDAHLPVPEEEAVFYKKLLRLLDRQK